MLTKCLCSLDARPMGFHVAAVHFGAVGNGFCDAFVMCDSDLVTPQRSEILVILTC